MVARKSGHIVTVSSVQGRIAIPHRSAYTASKHALQAFMDALRAEVAADNIKVTVISPGYVATNLSLNAVTGDGSNYGKLDQTTATGMKPRSCAIAVFDAIVRGDREVVLAPLIHRIMIAVRVLCPWLYFVIMNHRASSAKKSN